MHTPGAAFNGHIQDAFQAIAHNMPFLLRFDKIFGFRAGETLQKTQAIPVAIRPLAVSSSCLSPLAHLIFLALAGGEDNGGSARKPSE